MRTDLFREEAAERQREEERHQLNVRIEELRRDKEELKSERERLLKVIEEQAGTVKLLTDESTKQAAERPKGLLARLFGMRIA